MQLTLLTDVPEGIQNAGLDALDPRFAELVSLVERGEYAAAAARAEGLLAERILDVRVIGYYAYGAFLDGGVGAVAPLATALAGLFGARWAALGPEANKVRHAQASLAWFSRLVMRKLQREEATKGEDWQRWTRCTVAEVGASVEAVEALRQAAAAALGEAGGAAVEGLGKLARWLEGFRQVVDAPTEPEPAPEPAAAQAPEPPGQALPVAPPSAPVESAVGSVEGSEALRELRRKLAAFERLVDAGKLPQARIVADDLQATIEHFDPRLFFPELFKGFLRRMVTRAGDLAAVEEQRDAPQWKALADYYRVDLEGFLELEGETERRET
jgi:hypothetical protein